MRWYLEKRNDENDGNFPHENPNLPEEKVGFVSLVEKPEPALYIGILQHAFPAVSTGTLKETLEIL